MMPNPMGATFAERAAAARGDNDYEAPNTDAPRMVPNSTFASRAGVAQPEPASEPELTPEPEGQERETEDSEDTVEGEKESDVADPEEPSGDDVKALEPDDAENKAVQDADDKSGRRGLGRRR